jgi:hypothetical protein
MTYDLGKDTDVRPVDHLGVEQLEVRSVRVACFEVDHLTDVVELVKDEWAVWITLAVDESEYAMAFFPAVLSCQPSTSKVNGSVPGSNTVVAYLGLSGRKIMKTNRRIAGTIWIPHGMRKTAASHSYLLLPPRKLAP